MAEIPIQRKERSRLWPLLLLILIVVLVMAAVYLWTRNGGARTAALTDSTATQTSNGVIVTDTTSRAGRPPQ